MRLNSVHAIIDAILIKLSVLLTMPVASATAEWSFSVLRCLKNYVKSFRVSYKIESSTILKTDRQEFLKIVQNLPFVS
jgi:hypothetical protein